MAGSTSKREPSAIALHQLTCAYNQLHKVKADQIWLVRLITLERKKGYSDKAVCHNIAMRIVRGLLNDQWRD